MLIILTNICCDNCVNIKKEYKTLDENNVFELDVCTSAPGYIKLVFSIYQLKGIIHNWNVDHPSNWGSKQKSICINYNGKDNNAN